jgi:maltodextrin utilization protein YvdJ
MSGSSSSGSLDNHLGNKLFDQSHLPSMKRNRPLVYRKSQSPSKSMLDKFIKPTGEQQVQLMMMMMMMMVIVMMMMVMMMMLIMMMLMMIRATRTRLPTTMTRC